ncbi:hypothetical protein [Mycolicibacterium llatzerense]|nr:hypothetical protein [Mycolicibacterium llatzerense]
MTTAIFVLAGLAVAAWIGQRKLKPLLDRLEEDVEADEDWRPL